MNENRGRPRPGAPGFSCPVPDPYAPAPVVVPVQHQWYAETLADPAAFHVAVVAATHNPSELVDAFAGQDRPDAP